MDAGANNVIPECFNLKMTSNRLHAVPVQLDRLFPLGLTLPAKLASQGNTMMSTLRTECAVNTIALTAREDGTLTKLAPHHASSAIWADILKQWACILQVASYALSTPMQLEKAIMSALGARAP